MATEEKEKNARGDASEAESDKSSNDSDDINSDDDGQVEWLATSRAKRSTAGNRMKSMMVNEEPAAEDSDLELLFAEDGDDAGFTDLEKDDGSDVHMDSSDDDDDEDQEDGADDLEGEKELERLGREKKRLANKAAVPAKFRKKVRIEATSPAASTTRPKKKSERTSWLPSDMATRASQRGTTKQRKEQLHAKMLMDDMRRKKQAEVAEKKKAKGLEATKKPPKTQAERLAEAAQVEKRNAKSLNRWEEAEKQREEDRLKKIAALHSRRLEGPFVRFWSGVLELEAGQQKHVGLMVAMEDKAPRKKRQSAAQKVAEAAGQPSAPATGSILGLAAPETSSAFLAPPLGAPNAILGMPALGLAQTTSNLLAPPLHTPSPLSMPAVTNPVQSEALTQAQPPPSARPKAEPVAETQPEPQPMEGRVSQHYILLQNFDEDAFKDKQVINKILFGRRLAKLGKQAKQAKPGHAPLCALTNRPARYRDPMTGLPYANAHAFREIRRLVRGEYRYSAVLGGWVGTGALAARNVPDRFLDPSKPRCTTPPPVAVHSSVGGQDGKPEMKIEDDAPVPAPDVTRHREVVQTPLDGGYPPP